MIYGCYLRNGMMFVPSSVRTEAGFYLNVDPVAVVSVVDGDALRSALLAVLARGNPTVPTPAPAELSKSVLAKHAGQKSWAAFARGARAWEIEESQGLYEIHGKQMHPEHGWVVDPKQTIAFPEGTEVSAVVDRLIAIVQQAARAGRRTTGADDQQVQDQ